MSPKFGSQVRHQLVRIGFIETSSPLYAVRQAAASRAAPSRSGTVSAVRRRTVSALPCVPKACQGDGPTTIPVSCFRTRREHVWRFHGDGTCKRGGGQRGGRGRTRQWG